MSTNDHYQRDLLKRIDRFDIGWATIENSLLGGANCCVEIRKYIILAPPSHLITGLF